MASTVFYSWQKDLPTSTNWSFVEKALQRAIDALALEGDIDLEANLDRDTQDVTGMPDIVNTIFSKIDKATVFVGDISIVGRTERKGLPNPNVLLELGYAAAKLSWDNIICVYNLAYGDVDDLPFDLRTRRILTYKVDLETEKAEARTKLAKDLLQALKAILTQTEQRTPHLEIRHKKSPYFRFGIENTGSVPIEVLVVSVEYPKRIRLRNWSPMSYPPVLQADEILSEPGKEVDVITYTKTDAFCHGHPNIRRLPPLISPKQLFWLEDLNVAFTDSESLDTVVKVSITTREMGVVHKEFALSEIA